MICNFRTTNLTNNYFQVDQKDKLIDKLSDELTQCQENAEELKQQVS